MYARGYSYFAQGKYAAADSDFATIKVGLEIRSTSIARAQVCEVQGKDSGAKSYYLDALMKNPNPVYELYAYVKLRDLGLDYKKLCPHLPPDKTAETLVILILKDLHTTDVKEHIAKLFSIPRFIQKIPAYLQRDFIHVKQQLRLKMELTDKEDLRTLELFEKEYMHYAGQYCFHRKQFKNALAFFERGMQLGDAQYAEENTVAHRTRLVALKELLDLLFFYPQIALLKNLPIITDKECERLSSVIRYPGYLAASIQQQAERDSTELNQEQRWRVLGLVVTLRKMAGQQDEFTDQDVLTSKTYHEARASLLTLVAKEGAVHRVAKEMFAHHPVLKKDRIFDKFVLFAPQPRRDKNIDSEDESLRTKARLASLGLGPG